MAPGASSLPEPERRLAAALGPPPPPRAAFREAARAAFCATADSAEKGASEPSRAASGARKPHVHPLEDALRSLPADPARPAFRAELRARFVAGAFGDEREELRPDAVLRRRPAPRALSSGPLSWQVGVGLLATAAAVLLLVMRPGAGGDAPAAPVSPLRVLAAGPQVRIDESRVAGSDLERLTRLVRDARSLDSLDGGLEVELDRGVRFCLDPHTTLHLRREPDGAGGPVDLALDRGALHLVMEESGDAAGGSLVVSTPHAVVRIRGTVLSIDIKEQGTCICVASGTADVEILEGESDRVTVRRDSTCFVFADGSEPAHGPSQELVRDPEHLRPLADFRARQY